jgi:hypothetical protein
VANFCPILRKLAVGACAFMEDLVNNLATATVVEFESALDGDGDGVMPSAIVDLDSSAEVRNAAVAAFEAGGDGNRDARQCSTARSGVNGDVVCRPQLLDPPEAGHNHPFLAANHQLPNGALGASVHLDSSLTPILVRQRAAALFPVGNVVPAVKPELPAVVEDPTNELVALVYDASKDVTLTRGQLAREEVVGYLVADLLGIELLPAEALRLGESARKAALTFKAASSQLKNGASAKSSKLRKAAGKDAVRATRLDAELEGLGTELEAAHRKLTHARLTLAGLPNGNTKVIEKRAPIEPTPAIPPVPVPAMGPILTRARVPLGRWASSRRLTLSMYRCANINMPCAMMPWLCGRSLACYVWASGSVYTQKSRNHTYEIISPVCLRICECSWAFFISERPGLSHGISGLFQFRHPENDI